MNDEYFLFEWFLSEDPESKIEEKIPISEYETFLSEHGTIAEDILSACALKNIEQNSSYLSFNARMVFDTLSGDFVNALRESGSEYFSHENLSKNNCITIELFNLSKCVAFCGTVVYNVKILIDIILHRDFLKQK